MRILNYCSSLIMMSVFLFSMTSCSEHYLQEEDQTLSDTGLLSITTDIEGVATRSANLVNTYRDGDQLGLFITNGNLLQPYNNMNEYMNIRSTFTGGQWIQAKDIYLSNNNAIVYSYYPYTVNTNLGSVIPVDFTTQTDYMYGTHGSESINNGNPRVNLNMRHAGSLIQFLIKKENYTGEGKLTKVEIVNKSGKTTLYSEGVLNCSNGLITGQSGKNSSMIAQNPDGLISSIPSVFPTENDATCVKLLVIPTNATKEEGEILIKFTVDEKEYVWSNLPVATIWKGGHKNTYAVTIHGTELTVGTVTIEPWLPDGNSSIEIK